MSRWSNLPDNIFISIFTRLKTKDHLQCSLTCRQWKDAAQRVLFENLPALNEEKMNKLLKTLTFYQGDRSRNSPGKLVRHLNCTALSDDFDVDQLDRVSPSVKNISMNKVRFLRLPNQNSDFRHTFCEKLYISMTKGGFKSLIIVPFIDMDEAYLELVMSRKEDHVELKLEDRTFLDTAVSKIIQNIQLFPKLRVLQLDHSNKEVNKIYCIESMLPKSHPTLKSITFSYQSSSFIDLDASLSNIKSIQPLPNVKSVQIYNHRLLNKGDLSYSYIMNKFPKVDQLKMSVKEDHFTDRLFHVYDYTPPTISCLLQFMIYLFNMKTSTVCPIITDQLTPALLERYFNQVLKSETSNSLTINLKILFTMIDLEEQHKLSPHHTAYVTVDNKNCNFKRTCEVEVMYKMVSETREPYLDLFQKVGDKEIDCLTIGNKKWSYPRVDGTSVSMNTIFTHFTILKQLHIERIDNIRFDGKEAQLYMALERLRFDRCFVRQETYSDISTKCKNLKIIELFNLCEFELSEESVLDYDFTEITMPSTRLEKLRFHFSEDDPPEYLEVVFIKLRTNGKKTRYCEIIFSNQMDITGHTSEENWKSSLENYGDDHCVLVIDIFLEAATELIIETDVKMDNGTLKKLIFVEEDL